MTVSDPRETERNRFLKHHRWADATLTRLIPDASDRTYFRLTRGTDSMMLMDAPPDKEDLPAFVTVTRHLSRLGVRVPQLFQHDTDNGFLLLEDLGNDTFTSLLDRGGRASDLYEKAVDVLIHLHRQPEATDITLTPYDFDPFIREARLLVDWYLPAVQKKPFSNRVKNDYVSLWRDIYLDLPPIRPTLVLRDFHVDNLILIKDQCAVLDYQDALLGSPAYDLVSLLEDARRDLPKSLIKHIKNRYLAKQDDLDKQVFEHHLSVWGVQRHCKVAGIFIRLWLRDGKPVYLQHLGRVVRLLQAGLNVPALRPLKQWVQAHARELGSVDFHIDQAADLQARTLFPK